MSGKYYKDMTPSEQKAYRRKRKRIRHIRVAFHYSLVIAVILAVVVIVAKVFSVSTPSKTPKELPSKTQEVVKKDDKPHRSVEYDLTVSKSSTKKQASDVLKEENANKKAKEEAKNKQSIFSAKETDDTCQIALDTVVSPYAVLINGDKGEIVASLNANEKIYPASMTKIMTVYTAAKHLKDKDLEKTVTLSHEAVDYAYANDCSTSGFVEGEQVKLIDLFYGTICPSGGDAAIQLAIETSGDVNSFVNLMNKEVKKLGLSNTTHFSNPVGVYTDDNYSTVYDIAMILEAAMADDICSKVLSTKVYDSNPTNINPEGITISNWFLRRIEDQEFSGKINGAKTGYVDQSGNCAASCEIADSGVNYYCVTAGSSSSWRCIYDHVDIYKNYAK